MAKWFRMFVGVNYINFQIGVNIIGLPIYHTHTMIVSKRVNEIDAKKHFLYLLLRIYGKEMILKIKDMLLKTSLI
jgi:hypothetical protein